MLKWGTTVVEAASAPIVTSYEELEDMPILDKPSHCSRQQRTFDGSIAMGEMDEARDLVAWLLKSAGRYGVKVVNPGGRKLEINCNVTSWDDE